MDHAHDAPPPLDEPKTPLAFTMLGVGLFLIAAIYWIARSPEADSPGAEGQPAPAAEKAE